MDAQISIAWRQAGEDLGIWVVAPFELVTEDGEIERIEALIPDFGSPKGTLVANESVCGDSRQRLGYYSSNLFPSYRKYVRSYFIDTLNDWGWFGKPREAPPWYTGKS